MIPKFSTPCYRVTDKDNLDVGGRAEQKLRELLAHERVKLHANQLKLGAEIATLSPEVVRLMNILIYMLGLTSSPPRVQNP